MRAWSLARRRLRTLGRTGDRRSKMALAFLLSRQCLLTDGIHLHPHQLSTILQQVSDEIALMLDGVSLFDNEHGHQPVRNQEKYNQHGQHGVFLGHRWLVHDWDLGEGIQRAPRICPAALVDSRMQLAHHKLSYL